MKLKQMYPDYNHCILGIPNTLLRHYGVPAEGYRLPKLKHALKENHKNVVLMILDGMGTDMMQHQLNCFSFLRRHTKETISSVFPPTTVAATTSLYSGLSPAEHGWLGWAPYFKDLNQVVEIYTNRDFYTGESVSDQVRQRLPYTHIFDRIKSVNSAITMTKIFPNSIMPDGVVSFDDMCRCIQNQTAKEGEQFILAYWNEPDHTSHRFGPYAKEVKDLLQELNEKIKKMCAALKDTLVIITADHGHVAQKTEVVLNDYPDLMACLSAPLGLDMRTQSVFLKPNKAQQFVQLFNQYLSQDFLLLSRQEVLAQHLFGPEPMSPQAQEFLGDYLIVAKNNKTLTQQVKNDTSNHFLGQHSGVTNHEICVPLILVKRN